MDFAHDLLPRFSQIDVAKFGLAPLLFTPRAAVVLISKISEKNHCFSHKVVRKNFTQSLFARLLSDLVTRNLHRRSV